MIVNITPFSVAYSANKVEIRMDDFKLGATTGMCTVYFFDDYRVIKVERVEIPEEVYTQWGQDDWFVVNYVLDQLNLIADPASFPSSESSGPPRPIDLTGS